MQLELFPEFASQAEDNRIELIGNAAIENNFEVLLYANNNTNRELLIRTDTPEGNVIFSHINPEHSINVYIDGNTTVMGNLSITGDLIIKGKIMHIGVENDQMVSYTINDTQLDYDIIKNVLYVNGKENRNFFEIGKTLMKALKKYQDKTAFNDTKDFFNY